MKSAVLEREMSVLRALVPLTTERFERTLIWVTVAEEVVTAVMIVTTDGCLKKVTKMIVWIKYFDACSVIAW